MKSTYKAAFKLGENGGVSLEEAVREVYHWGGKFKDLRLSEFESGVEEEVQSGKVITVSQGDRWGFRLLTPKDDRGLLFHTDITLRGEGKDTFFNVNQKVGWQDQVLAPLPNKPIKPAVVNDLVKRFGASNGLNLKTVPMQVDFSDPKNIGGFLDLLKSSQRNSPVVYMSRRNSRRVPKGSSPFSANPNHLSSMLTGLAQVYHSKSVFDDKDMNKYLRNMFGRNYMAFDGAVRVFFPGKGGYMASNIYARDEGGELVEGVFNMLAELSSAMPLNLTFDNIKYAADREQATLMGDDQKLLEIYSNENDALRERVTELEGLERDKVNLEARLSVYESDAYQNSPEEEDKKGPSLPNFRRVKDVVEYAQSPKLEKVEFAGKAMSHAKKSPYRNPAEVFNALKAIDEFYSNGTGGVHPVDFFRNKGFEYKQSQSVITKGKFKQDYEAIGKNGGKLELDQHITIGSSHDPAYCISIAWDEVDGKAVIGSMSQHQRNSLS